MPAKLTSRQGRQKHNVIPYDIRSISCSIKLIYGAAAEYYQQFEGRCSDDRTITIVYTHRNLHMVRF